MGKKKFIDKKNSATFQLLARDSSFPVAPSSAADRVFVRVDNNPHYVVPEAFAEEGDSDEHHGRDADDPCSIFADAPDDTDYEEASGRCPPPASNGPARTSAMVLPEHVRKEILELGLPDDGYNYLVHLREIRKAGGGSNYYENSKAKFDTLPPDVRAYDASKLRISSEVVEGSDGDCMNLFAVRTVGMKVEKVLDPEVVRLLDDSDLSKFGSDVEDLEEDFVVMANRVGEGEEDSISASRCASGSEIPPFKSAASDNGVSMRNEVLGFENHVEFKRKGEAELIDTEKQRPRRPLDEQFDQLMLHEYDDDSECEYDDDSECDDDGGYIECNEELDTAEIKDANKKYPEDDFEFEQKYKVPSDYVHHGETASNGVLVESLADVMRRCAEYAQMYSQDDIGDEKVVIFEENSDESEVWDCETIVSTYSNLDNHPGRIQAPEKPKKRPQLPQSVSKLPGEKNKFISLGGKEMLPVDFLPCGGRGPAEKVKKSVNSGYVQQKRRPDESKEEKKERKAAIRETRREARQAKKELKGLYKCEAQLAQKVAAISGPSSFRIM